MKLILSFSLLLFTFLHAKTSDFSLIVQEPFDAALFDVTQDYDRTISAVGFSKEFKQNSSTQKEFTNAFDYLESLPSKHGSQMHLIKVGDAANIILSKRANLAEFNEAVAVVKSPENGYIVGGHTLGGELLIVKFDANANILYTKKFGTANHDKMKDLILLGDGGVLVVGTSATSRSYSDDIFEGGLGNNDIYLVKLSKYGEQLWSNKYGTLDDDEGLDAVEANDGSILVVGRTTYEKNTNITVLRLSENGDKLWMQHKISKYMPLPTKIIKLKNNNFLISLIEYNQAQKEHIRLIKFDIFGKTLADKEIFTRYPSGLFDIKEFANGTLIGVGYVRDTTNQDGLAMQLAANLTLLNQEHYGHENYDSFFAAQILHNSQVAVAGLHTDKTSQESNMWIVKLNQDATMAQVSLKSNNMYAKLCQLFAKEIKNHQLTIRKDLSIELLDPSLYFEVGSYKLTELQKSFLNPFSVKLFSFLQENKALIQTLEINGHTSSEWGNTNFTQTYLKNARLSMERSYATMNYIFKIQTKNTQTWLSQILKESGLSYSKKVVVNEVEDREKSRRVNFKVILK